MAHDIAARGGPGGLAAPTGPHSPRASGRGLAARLGAAALAATLLLGLPGAARAEDVATAPPAPTPSAEPTPSPAPTPSPTAAPTPSSEPSPTAAPSPTPEPTPTPTPAPTPVTVSRYLYRSGAGVLQYTSYWCVPASVQAMVNLILGTSDRSYATQKLLASATYRFNRYRYDGPGNDIRGWAGALNWRLPDSLPIVYRDRSYATRAGALDAIVDAIAETGYPVGITVWHGGHAWTVVGYRAREIPGDPASREPLGFYVLGPLGSPRDPWPVRYLALEDFLREYNRYYEDERREPWHDDYVLVRPERETTLGRDWPRP